MRSLLARQDCVAFNQPVGFDTSKVSKFNRMFKASAHVPRLPAPPSP